MRARPLLGAIVIALIGSLTTPLVAAQNETPRHLSSASKIQLDVTTVATPKNLVVGATVRDKVTIAGPRESWRGRVEVSIYGPFRTAAKIRCDGNPAWKGTFKGNGPGTYLTPPVKLAKTGFYTFLEIFLGDSFHTGFITPCRDPRERFKVDVRPEVKSTVSAPTTTPGAAISDRISVAGLLGEPVSLQAALFGPFGSRTKISCEGNPIWAATIAVPQDGEYPTAPVALTVPGYYTYQESIPAGPFVRAVKTPCGEASETSIVLGTPVLTTRISSQQTRPDAQITDQVFVSGLGALDAQVRVELWGPFARKDRIRCTGRSSRVDSFVAAGDGTYRTSPVKIDRVGYFSYRESIVANEAKSAVITPCGDEAETTLSRAKPVITTRVSKNVVPPGSRIFDRISVRGLGQTPAVIAVELFGPFRSQAAIRCGGTPFRRAKVRTPGNGSVSSPPVKVTAPGYYTYRIRLAGSGFVTGVKTECGLAPETALVRP